MKFKCKDCGELKVRIRSDRPRQVNRYYYVTETGSLWNGHQCPECKLGKTENTFNRRKKKAKYLEEIDDMYIYC